MLVATVGPSVAVDPHTLPIGHRSDDRPSVRRRRAARERGDEREVLPTGEDPRQRIDIERRADLTQLERYRYRAGMNVDADAARLGDVPEVGHQSVAHI